MARQSIDETTADRLLSGATPPDDAPPGYENVARLVRAVQAPAGPSELSGEHQIASLAAAAAVGATQATVSPGGSHRRNPVISRLGKVRAAAITAAAVLGAGAAAAAATGSLPSQTSSKSHSDVTVASTVAPDTTSSSTSDTQGNPNVNNTNPLGLPTSGPANFHAVIGLCRAFLDHNPSTGGSTTPPEDNSTAFQALRKDATGSTTGSLTATAAWCTTYLSKYSPGSSGSAPNNGSSTGGGTSPQGKPSSPGNSGSHSGGGSPGTSSGSSGKH